MPRPLNHSARWLFAVIFLLILALAASIELLGSSLAQRLLIVLIPFSAVVIGTVSAAEAQSTVESGLAFVLIFSGGVATLLVVLGAGPFSNRLVDIALIGSLLGLKHPQPLQTVVTEARQSLD